MTTEELITLLQNEEAFFASVPDVNEVVLFGSAMREKTIADDIDLLILPSRDMSPGERVDLRQAVWEGLKNKLPVALDVQVFSEELNKDLLASRGVEMKQVYPK